MFTVKESRIHGKGLFAEINIKEGTVIAFLEGKRTEQDGPHVLWIDDEIGFEVVNECRYVNHSPDPNAAYYDDLTLVALRDIQPGEEITHHYGETWEEDELDHEALELEEAE